MSIYPFCYNKHTIKGMRTYAVVSVALLVATEINAFQHALHNLALTQNSKLTLNSAVYVYILHL